MTLYYMEDIKVPKKAVTAENDPNTMMAETRRKDNTYFVHILL